MALPQYQLNPSNRTAREVARFFVPQAEMNPEYQRDHVWTTEQRVALVKSWIMGVPTGAVVINDRSTSAWKQNTGDDVYESGKIWAVVDGKQRIETARQWFNDELRVPRAWFDESDIDAFGGPDGVVSYRGLSEVTQRLQGNRFQLPVVEARLPSPQEEARLFLLLNGGGTAQQADVMDRARKLAGQ